MNQAEIIRTRDAVTVILAIAALAWFGCPLLFEALEPLKEMPWPSNIPSLQAMMAGLVMTSAALGAPGVCREMAAKEVKDQEMFMRSISITGKRPENRSSTLVPFRGR